MLKLTLRSANVKAKDEQLAAFADRQFIDKVAEGRHVGRRLSRFQKLNLERSPGKVRCLDQC